MLGWLSWRFCAWIGLGVLVCLLAYLLPPQVLRFGQIARIRRCKARRIAITYDDGPDGELTPLLIDLLRRHHVKATFFMVGFRAERFPEVCNQLVAGGHELGTHTYSHPHAWAASPLRVLRDTERGYCAMSPWLAASAPFRPPRGKLTSLVWWAVRRRGCAIWWWTHDGGDTSDPLPDPTVVVEQILQSPTSIVLLHNRHAGIDRQRYVLELTDLLIQRVRQCGSRLCTLSEILDS